MSFKPTAPQPIEPTADQMGIQRRTHFTIITDHIIDDDRVKQTDLLTFLSISRFADKTGACFPGISKICTKARLSRTAVINSIKHLEELGYLIKIKRFDPEKMVNYSNLYQIVDNPKGVVHQEHQGSAPGTPGVVRRVYPKEIHSEGISIEGGEGNILALCGKEPVDNTTPEISKDPPPVEKQETPFTQEGADAIYEKNNSSGYTAKWPQNDRLKFIQLRTDIGHEILRGKWIAYCSDNPGRDIKFFWKWYALHPYVKPIILKSCPHCGKQLNSGICYSCGFEEGKPFEEPLSSSQAKEMWHKVTAILSGNPSTMAYSA